MSGSNYQANAYDQYYANPFYTAGQMAPVYPYMLHNEDGSIATDENGNSYDINNYKYLSGRNIIYEIKNDINRKERNAVSGQVYGTVSFLKDFTATVRGDLYNVNNTEKAFNNPYCGDGAANNGRLSKMHARTREYRFTQELTWGHDFKQHHIDVLLAHESFKHSYNYDFMMKEQMKVSGNTEMSNFAKMTSIDGYTQEYTTESYLSRARYNFAERYFVDASFRRDGSSRFYEPWGNFWSLGASWIISQEKFMKNLTWIDNLKFRVSYGEVGNDAGADYYAYKELFYSDVNAGIGAFYKIQIPNKNLKWEGSNTTNLGIDLGFFDNRLNLTAEFFIKNTKDLLLSQSLAHITGFDSQMQNVGKIQNKGIELSLNSTNIQTRNFTWQTNFNISFIRNTLKSLASGVNYMQARSGFDSNFTSYDYMAIVGQSLGLIYGYEFDGIYQYSDFYSVPGSSTLILKEGVTSNPSLGNRLSPGAVKYKDQDGDGVITTKDRTVIGNALPKWYGGITNTFNYKGIDFSFMLQFNYGNDIYNATRLYATQTNTQRRNQLAEVADRWSPTNASNKVPRYNGYVVNDVYSRFVEDGSFLRLKNITLGYTLPHKWTRSFHVSKLRVYATGQNLFCLNNYSGYDPEVSTASKSPMTPGLDWGAYPKSRVFTFGIDLQF